MPLLILIIIIALVYVKHQREDEIKFLKRKVRNLEEKVAILKEYIKRKEGGEVNIEAIKNILTESSQPVKTPVHRSIQQNSIEHVNNEQVQDGKQIQTKVHKETISQEDSRNILILTAGAIFIILAAIVFLVSTWTIIPNILKTVILIVFIEVFLGLSKFAKEKLNLPNASNTFFYIAMAYIPICLYSISFFGLFGEFLSITGDGSHIYFTIINIIMAVIYMYQYNKKESKVLVYGSILMQYLSVIFFCLIFSTESLRVYTCLGLYNLLVFIFMNKFNCKEILSKVFLGMTIVLTILILPFGEGKGLMAGAIIVLAINYLCLEKISPKKIYAILFNVFLTFAGIEFVNAFDFFKNSEEIFMLLYVISVFIVQNIFIVNKNKENLKFSSIVVTVGTIFILQINSYMYSIITIPGYVYSIINIVILLLSHGMNDKFIKDATSILIPIEFICTYLNFGQTFDASAHYYMICAILTFVLGECIRSPKLEKLNKVFFYISHINLFFTLYAIVYEYEEFFKNFIYIIIITEIYGYSYLKNPKQNLLFKYFDYIFTNLSLVSICICFNLKEEMICFMPFVAVCIITFIEEKLPKVLNGRFRKDNFSEIFLLINSAIAIVWMQINEVAIMSCISLIYIMVMFYRYYKNNENMLFNIVPIIGVYMVASVMEIYSVFQVMIVISSIIGFGYLSLLYKNLNVFTIAGYISITFLSNIVGYETALTFVAFIYTLVHVYYMENDKYKDGLKGFATFIFLAFYNEVLYNFGVDEIPIFDLFGMLLTVTYLSRSIVVKYVKDIKYIEYIIIACIYLVFMAEATGLGDAISIILVQLIFMVISYYKKYGAQFVVNTAMLIVSALYLTKGFWALVPWWLYLLGIGTVLMVLAVRNEAHEQKEKLSVGKMIDNVIEKIEK